MTVHVPEGRLVRSRVVMDPGTALARAVDRSLTGYAVLEPRDALLAGEGGDGRGVLTFEEGVPVLAYHAGTDRGGPPALADLAVPGPCRCELYELDATDLAEAHEADDLRVPPTLPAERLAGDRRLAERTRRAAPEERLRDGDGNPGETHDDDPSPSALEAFLTDEEKVDAIREQARKQARERAAEWGLEDQLE